MAERFGCCSYWVSCSQVGYCTHRTDYRGGEYDGDRMVFDCALGWNLFLKPKEAVQKTFREDAAKYGTGGAELFPEDREKFERAVANFRVKPVTTSVGSGTPWTHVAAGIRIKGDELWMPKQTVIESKAGLELVSWLYKDITHYGIQETGGGMLEIFAPTPTRKGNALRAHAIQTFRERQVTEYLGKWPSVAMDVKDIREGHVLVYESRPGSIVFALVQKKTPSLIIAISNQGQDSIWLTERMDGKLQRREVQVIARETVPDRYNTFPAAERAEA